jgi:dTDP-4-amino-4,6-dideoxygalactose transaminase
LVHYPVPIPNQPAFAASAVAPCPIAAAACGRVLSVPCHPGLPSGDVQYIVSAIAEFEE